MNEMNLDAPALVRRRRRIARQQREKTPEPIAKTGGIRPKYSDDESSSTTTTANEYDLKRINPIVIEGNVRVKPKTQSNSSGGGSGNSSNVAYREKILNRRDRGNRPATIVRSRSTPRQLSPDSPTSETKSPSDTSGNIIRYLKKAKRSLSIPRYTLFYRFIFEFFYGFEILLSQNI